MDCSSITDFQQSTAICIAKKFRNLHIGLLQTKAWEEKETQVGGTFIILGKTFPQFNQH